MKKFLFTLATLATVGFAAHAYGPEDNTNLHLLSIGFDQQEITLAPGETQVIHLVLNSMDCDVILAGQANMQMHDANGNLTEDVTLGQVYSRNRLYFNAEGISLAAYNTGNSLASNKSGTAEWRWFIANTSFNESWYKEDAIGGQIAEFTLQASADWTSEYVTFQFFGIDGTACSFDTSDGKLECYGLWGTPLKINNANAGGQTKDIAGTVTLGDLEGYNVPVAIEMTEPTEGYTVVATVNGENATIENGVIVLGQDPDYGTYNVVVTVTAEGYEGEVKAEREYTIAQQTAATPVITFTPGNEAVTINVENYTSYEVIVNGVNKGQITTVEAIYDEVQTIVVNATNAPEGYKAAEATNSTELAAKAYDAAITPAISFEAAEGGVNIVVTDATSYEVIVNGQNMGQITYVAAEYNNPKAIVVNAVNEGEHRVKGEASETYELDAAPAKVYEVPAPVVTVTEGADAYTITATGEGTVTLYVRYINADGSMTTREYTNPAEVELARTYDNETMVYYWATATLTEAPQGYDEWTNGISDTEMLIVPAKEKADLTGNVTVTVDEEGNVTATYDGNEDVTITVDPSKLEDYGTYTVNYTVSAEGYNDLTGSATVVYNAPVLEQTDAPSSSKANYVYKADGVYYNAYTVTFTETEPSDIYYRIGVLTDGEYVYGEWMLYHGELNFSAEGTYMVEAYAIAEGKEKSTSIFEGFTVSVATSIEELFAGENVASVRYFNVAGQEMQEVNGLTIVVTTYTDGTQSAVKVMK